MVSAVSYISFSPVGLEPDDLHMYNGSGTLIAVYNTSTTAIAISDNQSYSFLVVPANTNLLGNHPDTWFDMFVRKARENAVGILIIFFCIALIAAAVRR